MKIPSDELENTFFRISSEHGFTEKDAAELARVFAGSTMDGVYSHGINRFPRFIREVRDGTVIPGTEPVHLRGQPAFEQWDGRQGAGILNALRCADRAVQLAERSGIGCIGLANTNHWMRGGTYGWRVADRGLLFIGWTNTMPNMPPWGGDRNTIGNNPFVLAIPRSEGHVVLDMAMSQYSYGKLEWQAKKGGMMPEYAGHDSRGGITRDPAEVLASGRVLPSGLWKGSAMAMVLDLAAAVLSGGLTTFRIGELTAETRLSQVFIAANIRQFMRQEEIDNIAREALDFSRQQNDRILYPGQRALEHRRICLAGGVEIPDELWKEICSL